MSLRWIYIFLAFAFLALSATFLPAALACSGQTIDFHEYPLVALIIALLVVSGGLCREETRFGTGFICAAVVCVLGHRYFQIPFVLVMIPVLLLRLNALLQRWNFLPRSRVWLLLCFTPILCWQAVQRVRETPYELSGAPQAIAAVMTLREKYAEKQLPFVMLNDRRWSELLAEHQLPAFVPGKLHWYGQEQMCGEVDERYQKLFRVQDNWQELLEQGGFNVALLFADTSLAQLLQELKGWHVSERFGSGVREEKGRKISQEVVLLERLPIEGLPLSP